ncbi:MAG: hypothetical protein IH600_03920 [Bacteroidetes bacterium]|nr:hypothetical protein [Bacteroidota bacterium]
MSLSLDTLYGIAFPGKELPDAIIVSVDDDPGVPDDHFMLDLECSADLSVEKVRMDSADGRSLALCADGQYCLAGNPGLVYVDEDIFTIRVLSPFVSDPQLWMPAVDADTLELKLYFTLIDEDPVLPCNDSQPTEADPQDDPANATVGAYPMVFHFEGQWQKGGNKGKKVTVIWKKDSWG